MSSKAYHTLYLLKRTFSPSTSELVKSSLYTSLVRSQLMYCSPLWRPMLIKDIKKLESLQKRATKFILGPTHYGLDYKQRLTKLKLLLLMYTLEIRDIMFIVSSIKVALVRFNILDYVEVTDSNTKSSDKLSLNHIRCNKALTRNYYFSRISVYLGYGINCHLLTYPSLCLLSKN